MTEETFPFQRVGILGLGLMGGSLARALSARPGAPTVLGWSPDHAEVAAALSAGALREGAPGPEAAAEGADLVVLAAPVAACVSLMETVAPLLGPACLVTDVASLKVPLARAAAAFGLAGRWVGAHPMCGSADSGFGASRPDLFEGARVWLCAHAEARAHLPALRRFWVSVGAATALIDPIDPIAHDSLMTRVSHLPQLTANALAATLERAGVEPDELGPGGREMTRLAGSSPEVWRDILAAAPEELPGHLRDTAGRLVRLAELLEEGDTDALVLWMARCRAWRTGS